MLFLITCRERMKELNGWKLSLGSKELESPSEKERNAYERLAVSWFLAQYIHLETVSLHNAVCYQL